MARLKKAAAGEAATTEERNLSNCYTNVFQRAKMARCELAASFA